MIHLIASYDGTNGILMFPVEQNTNTGDVEYRLRWPESTHPALREWGAERRAGRGAFPLCFPLEDPASPVCGEWRTVRRGEPPTQWQPCQPAAFGESTATFRIDFLKPRPPGADRELHVMGMSGDFPALFRITLPPHGGWEAGDSLEAEGVSLDHGPGQYVRAGAFFVATPTLRITCVRGSQATLRPLDAALPGKSKSPDRAFMVRSGTLPPEEMAEFLKQKEVSCG